MSEIDLTEKYRQVALRTVSPERYGQMLDAMYEIVTNDHMDPKDRIAAFKASHQGLKDIVLQRPDYVVEVETRRPGEVTIDVNAVTPENREIVLRALADEVGDVDVVNADL